MYEVSHCGTGNGKECHNTQQSGACRINGNKISAIIFIYL